MRDIWYRWRRAGLAHWEREHRLWRRQHRAVYVRPPGSRPLIHNGRK